MFVVLVGWGTRVGRDFGRRLLPGCGFRLGTMRVGSVLFFVVPTCRVRMQKPTRASRADLVMTICAANCPCTLAVGNSKLL